LFYHNEINTLLSFWASSKSKKNVNKKYFQMLCMKKTIIMNPKIKAPNCFVCYCWKSMNKIMVPFRYKIVTFLIYLCQNLSPQMSVNCTKISYKLFSPKTILTIFFELFGYALLGDKQQISVKTHQIQEKVTNFVKTDTHFLSIINLD